MIGISSLIGYRRARSARTRPPSIFSPTAFPPRFITLVYPGADPVDQFLLGQVHRLLGLRTSQNLKQYLVDHIAYPRGTRLYKARRAVAESPYDSLPPA